VELTMGYTRLSLDPDGYWHSSSKATAAAKQLELAGERALKALSGLAHMGGDDEAGGKFAHGYDKQAAAIFDGLSALTTALSQTASAFGASAVSHENAEAANARTVPPSHPIPATTSVWFAHPASAYGGTNIIPQGWTFIQELVSAAWPDGDTAKMRRGKAAWNALADEIDSAASKYISTLLEPLVGFAAPDIAVISDKTSVLEPAAKELSAACRQLAHGCGEYAAAVDAAHQESENELAEFMITSAAAIGISILLTPLTAGVSDLVGGAAVAADAVVTAARVSATLARLVARVAPLLVKVGDASRVASGLSSFSAKAIIFVGKTTAVGTVWSVASVGGDYLVNGADATPGEDVVYSLVSGGFAEGGKVLGEFASAAARNSLTGTARVGLKIAAEGTEAAEHAAKHPAHLAVPKHLEPPTPVVVKVTAAGIKTSSLVGGTALGAVAGQAVTSGVNPLQLPGDIAKDVGEGLVPILERGAKHTFIPLPK